MDLETAQTNATAKLPILKQGEYEMWRLRIEQYFQVQDYALWDVIENGNSFKPTARTTTNADGTSTSMIPGPVTTEEKAQKKNDVKARSMLLMALPNEHQLTFNQYKDAKTLFDAIQTRFGGNDAIRKTQKTLLKQIQLAILGENISQEDLNLNFLRSLPSEWNTHVVVWRNISNLDTMSFDDLYNNFKIVEQEVKRTVTSSSNSNSSSQNMAFVSSPSSTNEVNTANVQVSTANSPVSTADTPDSTANLSDATVYAFLANQPNGSQLVHKDLEQIHEDDLEEMDLKWQLALLSMRAGRYFQRTGKKITINGSDTARYDKFKVECFNCYKMGHFSRECRGPRNQDNRNRNQDSSRRTVNMEKTSSKAMVAIDLKRDTSFKDLNINALKSEIEKLKKEKESNQIKIDKFENASKSLDKLIGSQISDNSRKGYGPKASKSVCKDTSNEVKKTPDAPLGEKLVSKKEKQTIIPTKIESAKQQEKPARKLVKYAEMYRSQKPRGNQRNWNNLKSQQLGGDFVMYNKACFVCESFDHVQAHCNYHQREKMVNGNNYTRVNYNYSAKKAHPNSHRNMTPREILMKIGLKPLNTARPVNTAHPKTTVYSARPMSSVNTARPTSAVVNAVRANQTLRNLMEDMLPLGDEPDEEELLVKELLKMKLHVFVRLLVFKLPDEVSATLEATHADLFSDETEIDMRNLTTSYQVPTTPNTRIHKDHSLDHVIGDIQSGVRELLVQMDRSSTRKGERYSKLPKQNALELYMHDPLTWRLYDTCGVHHVSTETGLDIFMLVEKDFPLTRGLPMLMLVNKLQVDQQAA
ncbi:putative ribonuclease H-like domain-containing protein [Tanacetum coccineum]